MKASSSLTIFCLLLLVSCGAKKSATLEISAAALSATNASYQGGLVIMGEMIDGKERFTVPIPQGGSSNKVTIELSKGKWNFWAIGWEGNAIFKGTSKCAALSSVPIDRDVQTVDLTLSYAACGTQTDRFGALSFRDVANDVFKNLVVVSCGWLYRDNSSNPILPSTPQNFCQSGGAIDARYKTWARSVKLEVLQNINGQKSPGLELCLLTGADGVFDPGVFNFPSTGVPVRVTQYAGLSCPASSVISQMDFDSGLLAGSSEFDSLYQLDTTSTNARLFLPSLESKRGYSQFLAIRPKILCNGNPCSGALPSAIPGSKNLIIESGKEFVFIHNPLPGQACKTIDSIDATTFNPVPDFESLRDSCRMSEGRLLLTVDFSTVSSAPLTVTFTDTSTVSKTFHRLSGQEYFAYESLWEIMGYPLSVMSPDVRNSFAPIFDDKSDRGLLSEMHRIFGPETAAGFLGKDFSCTDPTPRVVYGTLFDEGIFQTYKVDLVQNPNNGKIVGTFAGGDGVSAGAVFEKLLQISEVKSSGLTPIMKLYFNCAQKVGRLITLKSSGDTVKRSLLEWNTMNPVTARVREFSSENTTREGQLKFFRSQLRLLENPSNANKAVGFNFRHEIELSGGGFYDFTSEASEIVSLDGNAQALFLTTQATDTDSNAASVTSLANLGTQLSSPASTCVTKSSFGLGVCSAYVEVSIGTPSSFPSFSLPDLTMDNTATLLNAPENSF